jgi:hypothetical protein
MPLPFSFHPDADAELIDAGAAPGGALPPRVTGQYRCT